MWWQGYPGRPCNSSNGGPLGKGHASSQSTDFSHFDVYVNCIVTSNWYVAEAGIVCWFKQYSGLWLPLGSLNIHRPGGYHIKKTARLNSKNKEGKKCLCPPNTKWIEQTSNYEWIKHDREGIVTCSNRCKCKSIQCIIARWLSLIKLPSCLWL